MCTLPSKDAQTLLRQTTPPLSPSSPSVAIAVTDHLKWARTIARGVSRAYQFRSGSQEEQDLEATVYLAIVELVERFDPTKISPGSDAISAFRGWAVVDVRCRCHREARRLRNGGTYNTRRETARKALIILRLADGVEMVDPRTLVEEDEDEADPESLMRR